MRSPLSGRVRERARASWTVLALLMAGLLVASLAPVHAQDEAAPRRRRGGGDRGPVTVLKVGVVHPVSGPAIENGVVVMRGNRIVAVGAAGETEVPEGATVLEYPDAHAYPGLIDALSQAFDTGDPGGVDAGTEIADGLDPFDAASRELIEHGITTAYVAVRSGGPWRGQGALIRPTGDGFRTMRRAEAVGLHMLLSSGSPNQHPLQRLAALENVGREFEQLEAYEKQFEDHETKKKEYDEAFEKYLAWHREKSGKEGEGDEAKPAEGAGEGGEARPERRPGEAGRGGRGGRGRGRGTPPEEEPKPEEKPAEGGQSGGESKPAENKPDQKKDGDKKDEAPKRPTFPKEPKRDPAKDALIKVRDGELALFVEAHRVEELERALEMAKERGVARLVFEGATGAAAVADRLRDAGCAVVVSTGVPPGDDSPFVDGDLAERSAAATLAAAGVPVAIGSGNVNRARHLTAIAAEAVGAGLDADAAVRALTLDAARVLDVAEQLGSLEAGKMADVVVTTAPLLSSRSRVLCVIASGRTVHTADAKEDR